MNKTTILYLASILIVLSGIYTVLNFPSIRVDQYDGGYEGSIVACTMEAKICPDGSYVGRTGPRCEFSPCSDKNDIYDGQGISQRVLLNDVYITPIKVLSDSRCPSDVQCIWAGTVLLRTKLEKDGVVREVDLELGKSVTFPGIAVVLKEVLPPKGNNSIDTSDYTFFFGIESSLESKEGVY